MANSTEAVRSSLGPFNLGNGLVEVAALTSMVGSTTAQTLTLGNKGPAGLVWASMTVFGAMSVVKTCIATVTPGWLRDSIGVRNEQTDEAVGLSLNLNQTGIKYRLKGEIATGVQCEVKGYASPSEMPDHPVELARRDVYTFDRRTENILRAIAGSDAGDQLKVYTYLENPYHTQQERNNSTADWIALLLSGAKLLEAGILWVFGATVLATTTLASWAFFLLASFTIQLVSSPHTMLKSMSSISSSVDVLSGSLPTPSNPGGSRKIILGVPKSPRQSKLWTLTWALGAAVTTASVVANYMALGQDSNLEVFMVWVAFQILWLILRSIFFYIVDDRDTPYYAALEARPWAKLGLQDKSRVRNLVWALAAWMEHVHPRGPWSYVSDAKSVQSLGDLTLEFPLSATEESSLQIQVQEVVGDTILASASWLSGSKRGGLDFYDTCLVTLVHKEKIITIPAARVLSGMRPDPLVDEEQATDVSRPPRGMGNLGFAIEWWYWIPCTDGRWLYFSSEQVKFTGARIAKVLTDEQVTKKLIAGELFISLQHANEVNDIVENSRAACQYLAELLA